jgi:hypothetical protein
MQLNIATGVPTARQESRWPNEQSQRQKEFIDMISAY